MGFKIIEPPFNITFLLTDLRFTEFEREPLSVNRQMDRYLLQGFYHSERTNELTLL